MCASAVPIPGNCSTGEILRDRKKAQSAELPCCGRHRDLLTEFCMILSERLMKNKFKVGTLLHGKKKACIHTDIDIHTHTH